MAKEFATTGGANWGYNIFDSEGTSFPFATLYASSERIQLRVKILWFEMASFEFNPQDISSIERYRALLNDAIAIKHTNKAYPPFILFSPLNYDELKENLSQLGYRVIEK
ncbi:MAG: hypothetical protein HZB51_13370 [Chloroflexi bacterium]|nr:hypothetical protein [Chloroflexota bacterium]